MDTQLLWGAPAWRLIVAAALFLTALASEPILRWLAGRVSDPASQPAKSVRARPSLIRPIAWVLSAGLLMVSAAVAQLPELADEYVGMGLRIGLVLASVFLTMRVLALALRAGETAEADDARAIKHLLTAFGIVIWAVSGILVIDIIGYPIVSYVGNGLATEILWGIEVHRLVVAGAFLLLGIWSRPVVRTVLRRTLGSRRLGADTVWVRDAEELLPQPLSLIAHAVLWYFVGQILLIPQQPLDIRLWVTTALTVALVLAITFLAWRILDVLSRTASRMTLQTKSRLDDQLIPMARKSFKIAVAIVVGIIIVEKFGYSTTSLIASLSVGGLALALAAKDTVANLFGSVVVFADQPFQLGDGVKVGDVEGVVEEVGLRSTRIRGFDQTVATVPNQRFTNAAVVNLSERPTRRIKFEVGLSYSASAASVEEFLQALRAWLEAKEGLSGDSVLVHLTQFADSSLTVLVQAMTQTADFAKTMVLQEEVLLGVMRLVESHGLELAFPTRTLHIANAAESAPKPSKAT